MSRPLEALTAEILHLPNAERTELLDRLVASLDQDEACDLAWDGLAAERERALESPHIEALDGPETIARLRAEFNLDAGPATSEKSR
jgi:hypothetical protein